jgi:hypothetical protein
MDTLAEGVVVTILVVVTHLGFLVSYGVANWFNGFVGDVCVLRVLMVGLIGNTRVSGELVDVNVFRVMLVGMIGDTRVSGELVDVNVFRVMLVMSGVWVDSVVGLRTEAFTVLTFYKINGVGEVL